MGGTKIEVLVMDDAGQEKFRDRVATPKDNYQNIIDTIVEVIGRAEAAVKQECSIGVCTPGSLSPTTGLMRNSNTVCLNDRPFKQDLGRTLGNHSQTTREISIANDANCFALSEAIDGSGKEADTVFGVIIGTGTGGGLVVNKKVLMGANSITGEWGHNPLPWANNEELQLTKCWCGQHGCIETFLSGTGLIDDYQRATQQRKTAEEVVELSLSRDVAANEALCRYEHRMARGLAHVINIYDPEVIVLGGGLSNLERLYKNIPVLWQQWIFSDQVITKLVPPKFGDSSGVRGAAWLRGDN